ncbi:hypothetical protein Nepgr_025784 [Nepenthes gracilis]|uniref:Protein ACCUMULATION AND REPLICATION OF CHLOROPLASTS 3 n=1 Tax=Nepenthes gracilis TaxID=150966 RepID=A0AAD3Y1V8_NEPGR|nr:hypothetical protein Nepgr_025784 [Nepenthes gracilis]
MEVPIFTSFCSPPPCGTSLSPQPSINDFNARFLHQKTGLGPLKCGRGRLPMHISATRNEGSGGKVDADNDTWRESECVEVIGIGSRVDSVLDFCIGSQSNSHSLRYWNVIEGDSLKGRLQERSHEKDGYPASVEILPDHQSHFKAVVLVAGAGYGDDHVTTADILRTIKSTGGFVVAIVLKPFSFEGRRRQDEVRVLLEKLQDCVNFFIEVDIDSLLKMDLVTLDEALKTMNRAVYLAITAVSVLVSGVHRKHIDLPHSNMKELSLPEVIEMLESYTKGKIGFGVGCTVESSTIQAVYDCPFFCMGLKDLNGVIICIVSSGNAAEFNDVHAVVHTFRQTTGCIQEIIISVIHNPDLQPNLISTTVIAVYTAERRSMQKGNILSKLAEHIPFIFSFLRPHRLQSDNPQQSDSGEISCLLDTNNAAENKIADTVPACGPAEGFAGQSRELQMLLEYDTNIASEVGYLDACASSLENNEQNVEGTEACQRELFSIRNLGMGYNFDQKWMDEGVPGSVASPMVDNPSIHGLPVGVRPDDMKNSNDVTNSMLGSQPQTEDDANMQPFTSVPTRNLLADADFEAFSYNASTSLKGKDADVSKRLGVLSIRAASMLETERDSKRRWSPVMEIGYRGGIYKGHCQGGLPEGRGCLAFPDGSLYNGTWHYGKRSGLGTFYFNNGNVFQGSWRDDLMHGKGWFYFHTGDRWFANFWKGKANGEGRFYSKFGEVFFGCFQDGWRHGRFLHVKVDGTRYVEIWNEGVLTSCEQLEPGSSAP